MNFVEARFRQIFKKVSSRGALRTMALTPYVSANSLSLCSLPPPPDTSRSLFNRANKAHGLRGPSQARLYDSEVAGRI